MMTRTHAFHASLYLCLASASLCLASAELFFLPWMPGLLLTLWIAFFIAWKFEGRWQLSDSAANYLGLLIAFTMLGWLVFQLPRTEEEFFAAGVPWPAGLLPHLGPLLMILTAVKLYRPKRVPDFWVMQLLGLMMVTLASVLAGELHHGLWLVAYLLAAHWCVYLYFQMRPAWVGLSDEEKKSAPLFPVGAWQDRQRAVGGAGGLGMASVWTLAALFLGMGLFFFAPRLGSVQWIPHQLTVAAANRLYTGPDPSLDLNRTGKIELSDEVAFEVSTQDAEGRTVDLPSDMYWRTETLDFYQNGRWFSACHTTDMWPDLPENGPARAPSLRLHLLPKGLDLNMGRLRRGEFWPHPSQRPAEVPADLVYLTFRIKQGPSAHSCWQNLPISTPTNENWAGFSE